MPEVTSSDPFGAAIARTIARYRIYSVLEIGAFDGDGSTLVLAGALSRKNAPVSLTSLEYNPERFVNLQRNSARYGFVHPVRASSIGRRSFSAWDFERDVWNTPFNGLRYPKEQVQKWHAEDVVLINGIERGYLEACEDRWDAVLIDGGEFTGYDEFRLVKDRTSCLMLDDSFAAFKTNRVRVDLLTLPGWKLIWFDPAVRNGAAIFVRESLESEPLLTRALQHFRRSP
jgi:hypothetical protein